MDPKPLVIPATITSITALEPVARNVAFPVPATSPFVGAVLDGQLHMVTLDATGQQAQHLALGRDTRPIGGVTRLPLLAAEHMVACAGGLALVGASSVDGKPVILGLDAQGTPTWQGEILLEEPPMVSPRAVCLNNQIHLLWVTGSERSLLWTTLVQAGASGQATPLELDGATFDLRAISVGHGLTLARLHSDDLQLELLRLVAGRIVRRTTVAGGTRAVAPDLVALGDRYALLWIAQLKHELCLQWFDWELRPTGLPEILISTDGETQLHSARFFQSEQGYLAISYQTATAGTDWVVIPAENTEPDRYEPQRKYEQFVMPYDWRSHIAGTPQHLAEAGIYYDACGWVGNALFLISGGPAPKISVYHGQKIANHGPERPEEPL